MVIVLIFIAFALLSMLIIGAMFSDCIDQKYNRLIDKITGWTILLTVYGIVMYIVFWMIYNVIVSNI